MIDFHSHILPAADDGAKDTITALDMLAKSYADGVKSCFFLCHKPMRIYLNKSYRWCTCSQKHKTAP